MVSCISVGGWYELTLRVRQRPSHREPCPSAKGLKDHPVGNIKPLKGFINILILILTQDEWFGEMGKMGLDIDIISKV